MLKSSDFLFYWFLNFLSPFLLFDDPSNGKPGYFTYKAAP